MLTPDLNLLRHKIGLADGEDFPWVHELKLIPWRPKHSSVCFCPCLIDSNHIASIKFLRSLLHLSRLDRKIDQRKKSIP